MDKKRGKTFRKFRDYVYHNPRADNQFVDDMDGEVKKAKDRTLYDGYADLLKRMESGYRSKKRQQKIDKLDKNKSLWRGLT